MRHSDQGDERTETPEDGITVLSARDRDAFLAMLAAPSDGPLAEGLRDALEEHRRLPTAARWRRMVERGLIDEQGNVLKRMPEPPDW